MGPMVQSSSQIIISELTSCACYLCDSKKKVHHFNISVDPASLSFNRILFEELEHIQPDDPSSRVVLLFTRIARADEPSFRSPLLIQLLSYKCSTTTSPGPGHRNLSAAFRFDEMIKLDKSMKLSKLVPMRSQFWLSENLCKQFLVLVPAVNKFESRELKAKGYI